MFCIISVIITLLLTPAGTHAKNSPTKPAQTISAPILTPDIVLRLVQAIPEMAQAAQGKQHAFLSGMTGNTPSKSTTKITTTDQQQFNTIAKKHGFELHAFTMYVSTLMATLFVLDKTEFNRIIPNKQHPRFKKQLNDTKLSPEQRQSLLKQIKYAQANKTNIYKQLTLSVSDNNKKVIKPLLKQIRSAFRKAETFVVH